MKDRNFFIPLETAQRASRGALAEIERSTGCNIIPEVKGILCKHLAGIMSSLEITGSYLTHSGAEKQIANAMSVEARPQPVRRKRFFKRISNKSTLSLEFTNQEPKAGAQ